MRIVCVLKADAQIGTGHLMRVKGLLPYFKEDELILCTDSLSESLYTLCSEYQKIIKASPEALRAVVASLKADLVLIDHYYLDQDFERPLLETSVVAVIDDLFGPRRHACSLLFDQYPLRCQEDYLPYVNADCELCVGAAYSLVKPCFARPRQAVLPQRPTVLINFGGADPKGCCLITARSALASRLNERYSFIILAGQVNPDYSRLKEEFGQLTGFEVLHHTGHMEELLERCHLCIGACGGSFLERICAGVPSLNVEIADNQAGANRLLEHYQVGLPFALEDLQSAAKLEAALEELRAAAPRFIAAGQQLIDGKGLERISRKLKSKLLAAI